MLIERPTRTQSAMGMLGLSDQEQIDIFAIVSAILHLGNARFATKVLYLSTQAACVVRRHPKTNVPCALCARSPRIQGRAAPFARSSLVLRILMVRLRRSSFLVTLIFAKLSARAGG
jgi:hypothetical protein